MRARGGGNHPKTRTRVGGKWNRDQRGISLVYLRCHFSFCFFSVGPAAAIFSPGVVPMRGRNFRAREEGREPRGWKVSLDGEGGKSLIGKRVEREKRMEKYG